LLKQFDIQVCTAKVDIVRGRGVAKKGAWHLFSWEMFQGVREPAYVEPKVRAYGLSGGELKRLFSPRRSPALHRHYSGLLRGKKRYISVLLRGHW